MEDPRADDAEDDKDQQGVGDLPEVFLQDCHVVEGPIADDSRQEQDDAVEEEDAPEGEGSFIEVPLEGSKNWVQFLKIKH